MCIHARSADKYVASQLRISIAIGYNYKLAMHAIIPEFLIYIDRQIDILLAICLIASFFRNYEYIVRSYIAILQLHSQLQCLKYLFEHCTKEKQTSGVDLGLSKGFKSSSESVKLVVQPLRRYIQAVWLLNYQNLRFREHLIDV